METRPVADPEVLGDIGQVLVPEAGGADELGVCRTNHPGTHRLVEHEIGMPPRLARRGRDRVVGRSGPL
ncbi:MAG TPA: hypothetical protein VN781_09480, partial [Acidimicrobiales bacterium]|nr:hypothetical protein [Acidimicrobiales bacterium]